MHNNPRLQEITIRLEVIAHTIRQVDRLEEATGLDALCREVVELNAEAQDILQKGEEQGGA